MTSAKHPCPIESNRPAKSRGVSALGRLVVCRSPRAGPPVSPSPHIGRFHFYPPLIRLRTITIIVCGSRTFDPSQRSSLVVCSARSYVQERRRVPLTPHTAFPRSAEQSRPINSSSPLQPHPQPGHSLGKRACAVPKYTVNYVGCTRAQPAFFNSFQQEPSRIR